MLPLSPPPASTFQGSPPALPPVSSTHRHLKEISELQSQQKQEIEALYRRLGKPLPPNLGFFHTAPPTGRRRKTSKGKLKAGKLLNPLVQQLKVVASSTGRPAGRWAALGWGGAGGTGALRMPGTQAVCRGDVPRPGRATGVFFFLDPRTGAERSLWALGGPGSLCLLQLG